MDELKIITLLDNYVKHMKKRRDYYWGRNQEIYNRYDCQLIVLLDIMVHIKNGDTQR